MSKPAKIGSLIRIQRKKQSLTIEQLAELANVSDKTIAKVERNETIPRTDTFLAICQALHITQLTYFTNNSLFSAFENY